MSQYDDKTWKAGDEVTIGYMGYTTDAVIIEPYYLDLYGHKSFNGFWRVREVSNSRYPDEVWPEDNAPVYEAHGDCIVKRGGDPPRSPGGLWA